MDHSCVRGIFDKRMWIAIENGIFDSNMVLPLLQENVTHVNLSSSHVPLLSFAQFFWCHLIRIESKIYAYVGCTQRTWDSNLLRRFSSSIECTNVCFYYTLYAIEEIHLRHLFDISPFVFFLLKKGNEKKSNNLCIEIKYLRKSSQNGWK